MGLLDSPSLHRQGKEAPDTPTLLRAKEPIVLRWAVAGACADRPWHTRLHMRWHPAKHCGGTTSKHCGGTTSSSTSYSQRYSYQNFVEHPCVMRSFVCATSLTHAGARVRQVIDIERYEVVLVSPRNHFMCAPNCARLLRAHCILQTG